MTNAWFIGENIGYEKGENYDEQDLSITPYLLDKNTEDISNRKIGN